jgi:membrane protein HdeD
VKVLAIAIGLLLAAVGIVGVVAPSFIVEIGRSLLIPIALYVVAAFRIGVGVVLLLAAPDSRLPTVLRIFGIVIILAGVFTLFVGVEHSRAILDWWSNQGPLFMRFCLAGPLIIGLFIVYAFTAPRRTAA